MKNKSFFQIYGLLTAAALVIAGICLMAACFGIFASGGYQKGAYTPAAVAQAFRPIAIPVILAAILALGSIPVAFFAPKAPKDKTKYPKPAPLPKPVPGWVRYAVLGGCIALIGFGYFHEGFRDVLGKAVAICTECVGLG